MNRIVFATAFLLGAIAVIWMGSSFIGSNALALTVTVVIGCVYTIGFIELLQYRQATATLSQALRAIPDNPAPGGTVLEEWLARLHPSLHNAVRLRIEGERVGLPAPAITPYLVGLLVMLGLLGTFVGMVETLGGAVVALEGTTELQAIRAGLAAPIEGLSLAFGTSVAGVAASAMLGLISTLSRRDRMLETRLLDSKIATVFRDFSLTHNRQETYKALQLQAQALPEVATRLQAMAEQLERMGDTLGDRLLANQAAFHTSIQSMYTELADSVGNSLRDSLADSGRLAGESIKPLVQEAMGAISSEARLAHQQMSQTAQQQLEGLSGQFAGANTAMLEAFEQTSSAWIERQAAGDNERLAQWSESLAQAQQQATSHLADTAQLFSAELQQVTGRQQDAFQNATQNFESLSGGLTTQWLQTSERMDTLTATLQSELHGLREEEEQRTQAAAERLAGLEATVATHLGALGKELEAPMTRLIQTASETPRAAAEVIGQLRHEISNNIERDNSLLEERGRLMAELTTLSQALENASAGQREAIEGLVTSSSEMLQSVGAQFTDQVGAELSKMSDVADTFAGSASQMSSLGDAFGLAIQLFNESNSSLIDNLSRIEAAMDNSTARSDEQMGYYVAQAREIIDQSMLSQRELFEEMRQLGEARELTPAEAI